ncbi:MAG: ActD-like protein [Myxococcaceae bacterium]
MIADWMLERYRLGELGASEKAQVEQSLAADPSLRERLAALDADSKQTLQKFPPASFAAEVNRRAERAPIKTVKSSRPVILISAFALAASLAVAVFVKPPPDILVKGSATLRVFKQTAKGPERVFDHGLVHPHDVVQVGFETGGPDELVVVSIDGSGHVTLHYPLNGNPKLDPGMKELPQSFELDDAPGFERFFMVTGKGLSADQTMDAARSLAIRPDANTAPLSLPSGLIQQSVRLDKVPR